ncbi:MAG: antitoxin Xre-like helix-turn-helix domain-containing protein [Ferruginibacter sp.]
MKKASNTKKPVPYKQSDIVSKVSEAVPVYKRNIRSLPSVKDFTYNEFKKIAEKTPFTQAEWAAMLHVSERTLQRYAKNNGSFAPINAERFLQINQVLINGKNIFGSFESFYNWIYKNPPMLEGELSFNSLTSYEGIQKVLTQLGRIEHGVLA